MKRNFKKYRILSVIFLSLILLGPFMGKGFAQSLLPAGLVIDETFKPGIGSAVGKTVLVQGVVVIIHEDDPERGYRAINDTPLYNGDTIITQENARVRFELNDGSILTLASETRIVINQSLYEPEKENRSSFISQVIGKARYGVRKLVGYKRSEFKVKSKTAVVGVRGSDFTVSVEKEGDRTVVTAFEDTVVEVYSLIAPEEAPVPVESFKQVIVDRDALPYEREELEPEEIRQIKQDFEFDRDRLITDKQSMDYSGIRVNADGDRGAPGIFDPEGAGIGLRPGFQIPGPGGEEPGTGGIDDVQENISRRIGDHVIEPQPLPPFPDEPTVPTGSAGGTF